jgi:hypothetical protein
MFYLFNFLNHYSSTVDKKIKHAICFKYSKYIWKYFLPYKLDNAWRQKQMN